MGGWTDRQAGRQAAPGIRGKWKLTLLACPADSNPDEFSLEPEDLGV